MVDEDVIMKIDTKKQKEILLDDWKEWAKRLKPSYDTIDDIIKDSTKILGDYYYTTTVPKMNILVVYPFNHKERGSRGDRIHIARDAIFYTEKDGKYQKLNTEKMIEELVGRLVSHISIEHLVRDVLYDTNPDDLREIYERVVEKNGSIKEEPGCYKLLIGGKKGPPFEMALRD
jgi:hypothetical protein